MTETGISDRTGTKRRAFYPSMRADLLGGFVTGFLAGVLASCVVAALLAMNAGLIADIALNANPTCATPRGLEQVRVDAGAVEGQHTSHEDDGKRDEAGREAVFDARHAVDGYNQTLWVPPLEEPEDVGIPEDEAVATPPRFTTSGGANVLTIHLPETLDVKLVCVVNGATLWWSSYQNAGRVRTVQVWGEDSSDKALGNLESLGADDFPNAQLAARGVGTTDVLHIALVDSYAGQRVESFFVTSCLRKARHSDGSAVMPVKRYLSQQEYLLSSANGIRYRYQPGCILDPKPFAGLAEIYVYAKG